SSQSLAKQSFSCQWADYPNIQITAECLPALQTIIDDLGDWRTRRHRQIMLVEPFIQLLHHWLTMFLYIRYISNDNLSTNFDLKVLFSQVFSNVFYTFPEQHLSNYHLKLFYLFNLLLCNLLYFLCFNP